MPAFAACEGARLVSVASGFGFGLLLSQNPRVARVLNPFITGFNSLPRIAMVPLITMIFGLGLAFYATPSTDAALSNVPDAQVGAASGIYKMASSLGNAIGVAVSAALYVAAQAVDPDLIQSWGLFIGRQDNVALRFGGAIGLLFNVFMVVVAIASIILTVPSKRPPREEEARPDEVAPPAFGN